MIEKFPWGPPKMIYGLLGTKIDEKLSLTLTNNIYHYIFYIYSLTIIMLMVQKLFCAAYELLTHQKQKKVSLRQSQK